MIQNVHQEDFAKNFRIKFRGYLKKFLHNFSNNVYKSKTRIKIFIRMG